MSPEQRAIRAILAFEDNAGRPGFTLAELIVREIREAEAALVSLSAARFKLDVWNLDGAWRARIHRLDIATDEIGDVLAEAAATTKGQAVVGAYSCALGNALAEADLTPCETCGGRLGVMGGRDAVTGKVVCMEHVTRRATT